MCAPFDRRRIRDNPLMELAEAYFGGIQDVSRRPNDELYRLAQRMSLQEEAFAGLFSDVSLWCDLWHAELTRLKD